MEHPVCPDCWAREFEDQAFVAAADIDQARCCWCSTRVPHVALVEGDAPDHPAIGHEAWLRYVS